MRRYTWFIPFLLLLILLGCNEAAAPEIEESIETAVLEPSAFTSTLVAQHSNKCLDVPGGSSERGARLQQWQCLNNARQTFSFHPVKGKTDTFIIKNPQSDLCVDISRHQKDAESFVVYQWACHAKTNQQFALRKVSAKVFELVAQHSRKCVDVKANSRADGGTLLEFNCHSKANQRWTISGYGSAPTPAPNPTPNPPAPNPAPPSPPGIGPLPVPNTSGGLPRGNPGVDRQLIGSHRRSRRQNDGTATWRTDCEFSHMNFDDPVVFPGQPGRSHLHAYFGNTAINANTNLDNLPNTGRSTCAGGTANRSGYWIPAMLDMRDRRPVKPEGATIYYKSSYHGVKSTEIRQFPPGLRILAGNSTATSPQKRPNSNGLLTYWMCLQKSPFKLSSFSPTIRTDCKRGEVLRLRVTFPQCWDGKNLDSADHQSHMAYAQRRFGGCPSSHPVALPEITINTDYEFGDPANLKRWRLVTDAADESKPAGLTLHGDWVNGWHQPTFERMLNGCFRPHQDCGHNTLNDGQGLQLVPRR